MKTKSQKRKILFQIGIECSFANLCTGILRIFAAYIEFEVITIRQGYKLGCLQLVWLLECICFLASQTNDPLMVFSAGKWGYFAHKPCFQKAKMLLKTFWSASGWSRLPPNKGQLVNPHISISSSFSSSSFV